MPGFNRTQEKSCGCNPVRLGTAPEDAGHSEGVVNGIGNCMRYPSRRGDALCRHTHKGWSAWSLGSAYSMVRSARLYRIREARFRSTLPLPGRNVTGTTMAAESWDT